MRLGLPHPSITGISQCMCTHLIDLIGIHLLHYVHGNERTGTHVLVCDTSTTITQDVGFHVGENNYMHFFQSHSTLLVDELTLCLPKMTFAP